MLMLATWLDKLTVTILSCGDRSYGGIRHCSTQGAALALAAGTNRLTSAVRIPTTPLRPGSSGSFGHEVAGSIPGSRKRTAAVHCHISIVHLPRRRDPPTRLWIKRVANHSSTQALRTPFSAPASFPFWAELKGVVRCSKDRISKEDVSLCSKTDTKILNTTTNSCKMTTKTHKATEIEVNSH